MKDKSVFKLKEIDADKLAESLGLANSPKLDFGHDDEVTITNTMSRSEQRKARVMQLREQAKKRKEQKKMQIWE